jgi:hypothetical protein
MLVESLANLGHLCIFERPAEIDALNGRADRRRQRLGSKASRI